MAAMFFGNLYWLLLQLFDWTLYAVVPIVLLFFAVLAIAEQFKMYGTKEVYLSKTRLFFNLQAIVQLLLIALVLCTSYRVCSRGSSFAGRYSRPADSGKSDDYGF